MRLIDSEIKQILLATTNKAKLEELMLGTKPLINLGIEIITLKDLKIPQGPEETGKTFEENSKLKAQFYGNLTGLPTIADDGGLLIPYLNNEPGVKSSRWLGREATDQELIDYTLLRLQKTKNTDRIAYLQTCLCFFSPKDEQLIFETEKIKGQIAQKSSDRPTHGYPYRALFIVEQYQKYYDELTETEHQEINHRIKALNRLIRKISNTLIK